MAARSFTSTVAKGPTPLLRAGGHGLRPLLPAPVAMGSSRSSTPAAAKGPARSSTPAVTGSSRSSVSPATGSARSSQRRRPWAPHAPPGRRRPRASPAPLRQWPRAPPAPPSTAGHGLRTLLRVGGGQGPRPLLCASGHRLRPLLPAPPAMGSARSSTSAVAKGPARSSTPAASTSRARSSTPTVHTSPACSSSRWRHPRIMGGGRHREGWRPWMSAEEMTDGGGGCRGRAR
ncbi:translation initiation factor IF-2-like [Panicum virgatum]|uniref:Uncharacterized protein n=1 Tax=Panicum virgatum TaxID=38727 RepID=A0A8T0PJ80_PANVG|nr:translation initiation factor IF-2-like [Panicum virgatum]KAG2562387.1 hypothetical protein PVAP13_8KG251402 [Panicum virgatum]